MFSVECPKCKNAIPLGMTECPICAAKEAADPAAGPTAVPASAPAHAAVKQTEDPIRAAIYLPPQPVRSSTPAWLVMVGVAGLLGLIFAGGYLFLLPKMRGGAATEAKSPAPVLTETPSAPGAVLPATHKYSKYIEVAGIRIIEENKKPTLKLLLINHSGAELADVLGKVELKATSAKPEDPAVGAVEVKLPSLGPYESKELSAPLKTTLRAYELPDWQFLRGTLVE